MTWKIVTDSGCDLRRIEELAEHTEFQNVPLTIQIGSEIFVDDEGLDVANMMTTMYASPVSSKSSCPSPDVFLQAYQGAENVIAITITGNLSGSQNSAQVAKHMLLEEHPNVNVHVIDSLSAGGEIDLIVEELNRLIAKGLSFDEVVEAITDYQEKTKLLFVLARVDNLVKNGRLSKLVGKVVGLLNIRMVGKASDEGKLELLHKARGQKKAVQAGYWNIFRYNPEKKLSGEIPFILDSKPPVMEYTDFLMGENRYVNLKRQDKQRADRLFEEATNDAKERYERYKKMAGK